MADFLVHKEIPVAGGMAGGSRRRRRGAARPRPALGRPDARRRAARDRGRARQRRALRPHRRHRARHRPRRAGDPGARQRRRGGGWSCRPPPAGSPRPRSTGASTRCSPARRRPRRPPTPCWRRWPRPTRTGSARALHNDLQEPALDLRPDLGDLLDLGESEGAMRGLVSGSGPTCLFLAESPTAAHARGRGAARPRPRGRTRRRRPGPRRPVVEVG